MKQHFKNMKIKKKLMVAFLGIAILASLSGVIGSVLMHEISSTYDYILVNHGFAQGDVGKALAAFCRLDGNVHDAVNYEDEALAQNAYNNIDKLAKEVHEHLDVVEPTLESEEAKKAFADVKQSLDKYLSMADEVARKGMEAENDVVVAMIQNEMSRNLDPLCQEAYQGLVDIMDIKVNVGNADREDAVSMSRASTIVSVCMIVAALALSLLLGNLIANGIAKPMIACCQRLLQLKAGDLKTPVPEVESEDEVGQLTETTGAIVDTLNKIIGDINYLLGEMSDGNFDIQTREEAAYQGDLKEILVSVRSINRNLSNTLTMIGQSAEQVACGADQVSTGAQALAQGATEQASAVEELSATIIEIEHGAEKNAENSRLAMEHSQQAGTQVQQSSEKMEQMIQAMGNISESSIKIGNIIATIENIAFQTNILALNAAVEAARAGSAGKGFAVVADEVRNLASKSDEAAKATKVLIEAAINAVQDGENNVQGVSAALEQTVKYAGQVMEDIQAISNAAAEQSEAIEQVTTGIEQISSVVQTNSATSEESAAASEELSGQAELMKQEMDRFRLRADSPAERFAAATEAQQPRAASWERSEEPEASEEPVSTPAPSYSYGDKY